MHVLEPSELLLQTEALINMDLKKCVIDLTHK